MKTTFNIANFLLLAPGALYHNSFGRRKNKNYTLQVYNCHFNNKVKIKILYPRKIFIQDCVSGHKCKSYNVLLFVNDITICDLQDIIVRGS